MSSIVLHRDVMRHWLWANPERLKWWLDMLFLANECDVSLINAGSCVNLSRGQFISSVKALSERWGKSHPIVIKFLKQLEKEGLIQRHTYSGKTAIISIVNYDSYEGNTDVEHYIKTIRASEEKNQQASQELATIDPKPIDAEQPNEEMSKLLSSHIWKQTICMQLGITQDALDDKIQEFYRVQSCIGNETIHSSLVDAKKHFYNWIKKQYNSRTRNEAKRDGANQRRGSDAIATTAEEYKTTF